MTHETGGSGTRDRRVPKDGTHGRDVREHDPYEERERETRDMPERHSTQEPRRSFDERDIDIREGYR
jgi:hypothetical protein